MDTEFINRYIQRQTDLIQDLIKKNLMLEVQLSLANDQVALLNAQVQDLTGPTKDAKDVEVKSEEKNKIPTKDTKDVEVKSEEKNKIHKKIASDENF